MDQAIFDHTLQSGSACARFYAWNEPAITVGYFHEFKALEQASPKPIRRFTGGGLVEHGDDLTFVLTLPADSGPAKLTSEQRYRWIHQALAAGLNSAGFSVILEANPTPSGTGACFQNSVTWDLISPRSGEKLGGGAQRRSGGAVIHQGSVRLPIHLRNPEAKWIDSFLAALAKKVSPLPIDFPSSFSEVARMYQDEQFSTDDWNRWTL